jgi:hypothetical protein
MSDGSGRVVEAHEAAIHTATVEVKTLTIKGRQLTLSVFRQIVRESVLRIDRGGVELNGTPWGWVKYHPAPCDNAPESHLHVIWQKGGELRRACVDEPNRQFADWLANWREEVRDLNGVAGRLRDIDFAWAVASSPQMATVTNNASGGYNRRKVSMPSGWSWDDLSATSYIHPGSATHEVVGYMAKRIEDGLPIDDLAKRCLAARYQSLVEENEWMSADGDEFPEWPPQSSALSEYAARLRAVARNKESQITLFLASAGARYRELQALPQLFIAV